MKRSLLKSATIVMLILLVLGASSDTKRAFGQDPRHSQSGWRILTPILGNYPNTSLALSTNTTVVPDAEPINTMRINVLTSTNFKGRLEGYPATGVVRVTDAHPAGTYTVTVTAFDSTGATATQTFTLTVTTPATCSPVSFAVPAFFGAGDHPWSVAVGDFNADGKQDLAVGDNISSGTVSILLGNGDGTFRPPTSFSVVGGLPQSIAVGDFNSDGKQDLAVAIFGDSYYVAIFLGDGAGNFGAAMNFGVGPTTGPIAVVVGDFNRDSKQDLAVAKAGSDNVSILLGDGAGDFSAVTNFAAGDSPRAVAVGDFNNDGKQDLAVANYSNNVSILLGDGAGNFSNATNFGAGSGPFSLVVGDFNANGKQDLAVVNYDSNNVSILLGNGAGGFSTATNFVVGSSPTSVALGDFNGDGKQDLAVTNLNSYNVSILFGAGDGTFSAATNFDANSSPISVAVGDFNGDGRQDLAVPNLSSNNVSLLLRNCTPTSAVSRKTHASAGSFDINLPLAGAPGIECRTGGATNDHQIVVTYAGNVTVNGNPQAAVYSGTGTIGSGGASNGGMVSVNGNTVTIPLTNVVNAQTIYITLNGVNGGGNLLIPMSTLAGDVNGNRAVNASDVSLAKSGVGQAVDATNFRSDVNANGTINASDVSIVKSKVGTGVP